MNRSNKPVRIEVRRALSKKTKRVVYWVVQCSEHGRIQDRTHRWDKKTAVAVAKAHVDGAHPHDDLQFRLDQK